MTDLEAAGYLRKAEEFYQAMLDSYRQGRWNAAGLDGVHCAISATDAVLGLKAKVRSAGESHYDAIELLRSRISHESADQQASRLARIIGKKHIVEYDARDFTDQEAAAVVKDVGRYLDWVKAVFAGHA